MCIKLSDFLRNTLSLGEKQSITLGDELALAQAYWPRKSAIRFAIEDRNEDGFRLRRVRCASAVSQPLVENAVKHGIAGLVDGGTIRLEAHCENGWLQVTVQNEFDPDAPAGAGMGWDSECPQPAAGDLRKSGAAGHHCNGQRICGCGGLALNRAWLSCGRMPSGAGVRTRGLAGPQ